MKSEGMQSCVNQNSEVNGLERALSTFLSLGKLAGLLAQVLIQVCKAGKVSHDEVEEMLRDDPEDVLLLGFQWRLLLQIKKMCKELDLEDRVDFLIAELKGSGVMTPKLSSLAEVMRETSSIYELNPSLCVNTTGK